MKIIENGNFSGWFRCLLYLFGLMCGGGGLAVEFLPGWVRIGLILVGVIFASIGGFSSKAHALQLKPFDRSCENARKSYENVEKK